MADEKKVKVDSNVDEVLNSMLNPQDEPELVVEPAVRVEEEEAERVAPPLREPEPGKGEPPAPTVEERLAKALESIETLREQVEGFTKKEAPRAREERAEPQLEYEDVFGIQIPKDRSKRPVQLTPEQLIGAGWNEDPAAALEKLGNVLFYNILGQAVAAARNVSTTELRVKTDRDTAKAKFERDFPDVQEHEDLVEVVEAKLRGEGWHQKARNVGEYLKEVGTQTRKRIASIKGVSIEDYEAGLPKAGGRDGGDGQGKSRATLSSPGSRGGATRKSGTEEQQTQQREMQELLE